MKRLNLNEVMLKLDDNNFAQIMKLKITDYIFASLIDGVMVINYVTPKLASNILGGKKLASFDVLNYVLFSEDYKKIANIASMYNKDKGMEAIDANIKGNNYKIFTINNNGKIIMGLQKLDDEKIYKGD